MKLVSVVVLVVLAAYGAFAWAQQRLDARPSLTPITSSSSNGFSFTWFYDFSSRAVYVCVAGSDPASRIECKASAAIP